MLQIEKITDVSIRLKRINNELKNIEQVKNLYTDYIKRNIEKYCDFCHRMRQQWQKFQQKIVKGSFYSSQKSSQIVKSTTIYGDYLSQLEKRSKINLISLEKNQNKNNNNIYQNRNKYFKKTEFFNKEILQYKNLEINYNQKYIQYNNKCQKLKQIIDKFKTYQHPLLFYNHIATKQYRLKLEQKYNQCLHQQALIITDIQILDQKRKWIVNNRKQVTQTYLLILHSYLTYIQNLVIVLVYSCSQDDFMDNKISIKANCNELDENLRFTEIQKFDEIYLSNRQITTFDDVLVDFSDLFKKIPNQRNISSQEQKLFLDRCQNYLHKKYQRIQQDIELEQKLLKQIQITIKQYIQFDKQFVLIEKQSFKADGIQSFKKKYRNYFGNDLTEIMQLSLLLIKRPKKLFQKILKYFQIMQDKINKIIQMNKSQLKNFSKKSLNIFTQHRKIRQKLSNKIQEIDGIVYQQYRKNIYHSFEVLKNLIIQFEQSQKESNKLFLKEIKSFYKTIMKQNVNENFNKLLHKQKTRIQILDSLKIDTQIISILKQGEFYQVFFDQNLKSSLFINFKTNIKQQQYQKTYSILQKKQTKLKRNIKPKKSIIGCCSANTVHQPSTTLIESYDCQLLKNKKQINGLISIFKQGITFEQKTYNPFINELRIMIPQSDIINFALKESNATSKQSISITTDMGDVIFISKQVKKIMSHLQNDINFELKDNNNNNNKNNQSSTSFQKNSSFQFKIPLQSHQSYKSNNRNSYNSNKEKNKSQNHILKLLIQKWEKSNLFNDKLSLFFQQQKQKHKIKTNYQFMNSYIKFILKQHKQALYANIKNNNIQFKYQWKICFPQQIILQSFKHYQNVEMNLEKDIVFIKIIQKKHSNNTSIIRKKLYEIIEEMNTNLCNFIVKQVQKEGQIEITQQEQFQKKQQYLNNYDSVKINDQNGQK